MRTDDIKYAPRLGPHPSSNRRSLGFLESIALAHTAIFLVATTWAFGGQAEWVRVPLSWWGSLGALITLAALRDRAAWRDGWMRPLHGLWPMAAFNVLVLIACLNPSFRELKDGAETLLVNTGAHPGLPSSARPLLALQALWLFDAVWISCFNIALVVRQGRALRLLLLVIVGNAFVLAVFGTAQKLSHAQGLYFDAVPSPQVHFFASFVYHNHWGAFMLLTLSACLGLSWHYARRSTARNILHSPALAGLVVTLVLAATIPLSASRSSTLLALPLLGGALLHGGMRLVRERRRHRESIAMPLLAATTALVVAGAAIWYVARDTITVRLALTRDQVTSMREQGGIGSRAELYRDTWRMAQAKLGFGWGMASYPHVFMLYNSQESSVDRLPIFYRDAHSDWLQAFAEHGLVGSALLGLCAIIPLLRLRRRHFASPLVAYPLAGCAVLLAYAWIEFPFGNVAVVLTWWLCFFCAVHYAHLQDRRASRSPLPA